MHIVDTPSIIRTLPQEVFESVEQGPLNWLAILSELVGYLIDAKVTEVWSPF